MKKIKSLIIGTGVIGAYLSKLLIKKKHSVVVTSRLKRKNYRNYEKLKISKKVAIKKLNILDKKNIKNIIKLVKPDNIFYLAGQSSLPKSFKLRRETIQSNYVGAKNFLEVLNKIKKNSNFFKANSGYILKPKNGKISLNSKLIKPNNPYVEAQQKAYKLVKKFRKKNLKCYSLIFMQIESPLRDKSFFIKKVCLHAKKKKKVIVGNINTVRDYSWIEDIVEGIYFSTFIKPCDLIFSSGSRMSGKDILKTAYRLNKLNYKKFFKINKNFIRKKELKTVIGSNNLTIKKLKKFGWRPKIIRKKLVEKIYKSL